MPFERHEVSKYGKTSRRSNQCRYWIQVKISGKVMWICVWRAHGRTASPRPRGPSTRQTSGWRTEHTTLRPHGLLPQGGQHHGVLPAPGGGQQVLQGHRNSDDSNMLQKKGQSKPGLVFMCCTSCVVHFYTHERPSMPRIHDTYHSWVGYNGRRAFRSKL